MSLVKILKDHSKKHKRAASIRLSVYGPIFAFQPEQKCLTQHPLGKSTFDSKRFFSVIIMTATAIQSAHQEV